MNEMPTNAGLLTASATERRAPAPPSLAQRLVLKALDKMTAGCLRLVLPDGEHRTIGTAGSEISATMHIRDAAFFQKCLLFGDVGFGESYLDGDWETD